MFRFVLSGVACALLLALGLAAWAVGTGSSGAQSGSIRNCPPAAKWSMAVWDGQSGTAAGDALATCGVGAVDAAYSLDPQTGGWLRWFAGKPAVSNLPPFNNMQAALVLGSATGPVGTPTPTPTPTPTSTPTPAPTATPTPTPTPTPGPSGRIAFDSNRNGNYEIYVMNADGTGQTKITNNSANDLVPAWSPDGSRIAFDSYRDGNFEIYVMNADGSGQTRITNNTANDESPDWSPAP